MHLIKAASSGAAFLIATMIPLSLQTLVLANLCASLFMTGILWFVQVVHYPLFAEVGSGEFVGYERRHTNRTSYVVAPPMLFELAASVALAWVAWSTPFRAVAIGALALTLVAWASTFALQVPCHNRLCRGFHAATHRQLVRTNWIRTLCWTARSVLLVWLLLRVR